MISLETLASDLWWLLLVHRGSLSGPGHKRSTASCIQAVLPLKDQETENQDILEVITFTNSAVLKFPEPSVIPCLGHCTQKNIGDFSNLLFWVFKGFPILPACLQLSPHNLTWNSHINTTWGGWGGRLSHCSHSNTYIIKRRERNLPGSGMCRDAYVWCVVVIKGKGRVERLDAYSSLLLPLTRVFLVARNISLRW